jgi:F0F1-type ATP synthase epsilon subunit
MGDDKKDKKQADASTEDDDAVVTSPVSAQAAAATTGNETMHIKVYSPFKVYFDGEAKSLSAVNLTGPFDILPKHHNFMTLLDACELVVRTTENEQKISITRGVMHVKADQIIVFLDV